MSTKNIDDLIVKVEHDQMNPPPATQEPIPELSAAPELPKEPEQEPEVKQAEPDILSEDEKPVEVPKDNTIDEYGNPIEKPKTYSEEDVQRIVRDRLSRGKHAEQQPPTQREVIQRSDDFKVDPNSDENWEVQLENFIEKTIEKKQTKANQEQWQKQEMARQIDFESKFSTGMTKYADFHNVVSPLVGEGKITDSMMLATRNLENPAAFIYGASKLHSQDLERISRIADPYVQAAEVGRLHERMVKTRNNISNAPKPLDPPRADMPIKMNNQPSLENRIDAYAKQKRMR